MSKQQSLSNDSFTKRFIDAAGSGNYSQVASSIKRDANIVNAEDSEGRTALSQAIIKEGNWKVIDLLLRRGADVNKVATFIDGGANGAVVKKSPFQFAMFKALTEIQSIGLFHTLLDKDNCGNVVNRQDENGQTPLMLALIYGVKQSPNASIFKYSTESIINKNSINLNITNNQGQTALDIAKNLNLGELDEDKAEALGILIKAIESKMNSNSVAVDVHKKEDDEWKAFDTMLDAMYCWSEFGEQNNDGQEVASSLDKPLLAFLFEALERNDIDAFKLIFENKKIDLTSMADKLINVNDKINGNNLLMHAVLNNRAAIFEILLSDENTKVNLKNDDGLTALRLALRNNRPEFAMKILKSDKFDLSLENESSPSLIEFILPLKSDKNFSAVVSFIEEKMAQNDKGDVSKKRRLGESPSSIFRAADGQSSSSVWRFDQKNSR